MHKKTLTIFLRTLLLSFIIVFVILKMPILKQAKNQRQYVLSKDQTIDTIEITPKENNKSSVIDLLSSDSEISQSDPFEKWAILDNKAMGYKFIYPYGFTVETTDELVTVAPPNKQGFITIQLKNKDHMIDITGENLSEDQNTLLEAAKQLIEDSFMWYK